MTARFVTVTGTSSTARFVIVTGTLESAPWSRHLGVREFVREFIASNTDEDSPRRLHARAIAHFMTQHRPISFDYGEFRVMAEEELSGQGE